MKVQPIRDINKIEELKNAFETPRDRMLFILGINTGYRISDLLVLKKKNVIGTHICVKEEKTSKDNCIFITDVLRVELDEYTKDMKDDDYLFPSLKPRTKDDIRIDTKKDGTKVERVVVKKGEYVLSRIQAYKILNDAAHKVGITENIGTHTLRKTMGYHYYKQFKDVAELMVLFNHSAPSITLKYIGISQENLDTHMKQFGL